VLETLAAMVPQQNIVMLLREPAFRVLSSFRFTRDNLGNCDKALTFNQYVDRLLAGNTNQLDRHFRSETSLTVAKRELELGKYSLWLDRWLKLFQEDRVHPMLFEQLRDSPAYEIKKLCESVGVDPEYYNEFSFSAKNPTYSVGKQNIHRMARHIAPMMPRGPLREVFKEEYLRWQRRRASAEIEYQEGVDRLRSYLGPWNRELEGRYGLNVRFWWGDDALAGD
jgi:hypothetical protein